MKKNYISPRIKTIQLRSVHILATSPTTMKGGENGQSGDVAESRSFTTNFFED